MTDKTMRSTAKPRVRAQKNLERLGIDLKAKMANCGEVNVLEVLMNMNKSLCIALSDINHKLDRLTLFVNMMREDESYDECEY